MTEPPGSRKDEQADQGGEERIGVRPSGEDHDQGGGDHGDRPGQVRQELELRAPEVDRLPGTGSEQAQSDQVDEKTGCPHHQHGSGQHIGRFPEPLDRLVEDVAGNCEEQRGVGQGGQDLQPVQPEGPSLSRRRPVGGDGRRPGHS